MKVEVEGLRWKVYAYMIMEKRKRKLTLAEYLLQNKLVQTTEEARIQVLSGNVVSQNKKFTSIHEQVNEEDKVRLKQEKASYVSRGGDKLASVFMEFDMDIIGKTGIDCGASSGGFTDYLLQNGAGKIITLDVNYGLLAHKLRVNPDVINIERVNIRELDLTKLRQLVKKHKKNTMTTVDLPADFIVADLSFISLRLILPAIGDMIKKSGDLLLLFKPQFEVKKEEVPDGGIIKSEKLVAKTLADFIEFCESSNYIYVKAIPSKVKGSKGNQEIFLHLKKDN